MSTILTLDVGNTNASLAFVSLVAGRAPLAQDLGGWSREEDEPARLAEALDVFGVELRGDSVLAAISAVGASERERRLADALAALGFEVIERPVSGLHLAIDSPETCGSDRQYAMRAALELSRISRGPSGRPRDGRRVIVVDAGTAVTVDAGEIRTRSTEGATSATGDELVFLGGAIALGPGSLAEAISARGARLPAFAPDASASALGRSTHGALQSGASVGFRGAVRELVTSIASEAFGGDLEGAGAFDLFLTGGARDFARAPLVDIAGEGLSETPSLVHIGLALAADGLAVHGFGGMPGGDSAQAGPG
ncbi:MAG: type III pantothenate kinase [Planctomycetota bacterium]